MQNNHSKNGTIFVTCHGGALAAVRVGRDRFHLDYVHLDHGRAGIQAPDALVRQALHRRLSEGEKVGHGPLSRRSCHARKNHSPLGCFQAGGAGPRGRPPPTPPAPGGAPPPPPPPPPGPGPLPTTPPA